MGRVSEEERLARVVLSRISEPGQLRLTTLVQEKSAVFVLDALRQRSELQEVRSDLDARLASADGAAELERAASRGLRFVVPGDDEWPVALDDLEHVPPLHDRGGMPIGLWLRGAGNLAQLATRSMAIVGSRSSTTYGEAIAGELAHGIAVAGRPIVSGAAFGIDVAAHRGCLAARTPTIAVLACGADRAYPAGHRDLLDYIAEDGVVVSESPPGAAPMRVRFLGRNRLIAGLSQGVVVVEAAIRSGALNTANWAGGLGRIVMGVPGPVTSAASEGVHQLIRNRDALLVTRAEEVLEATGPIGEATLDTLREEPHPRDLLSNYDKGVLDAVPAQQAAQVSSIARTAGRGAEGVHAALDRLAAAGLVEPWGDSRWRLAQSDLPGLEGTHA